MRRKAVEYYAKGYNCSQCILKAAEWRFHIPLTNQMLYSLSGVNNGFGVGQMCSVLIAGVMVFGMIFDPQTTRDMRMDLLSRFQQKYGSFYCAKIVKMRENECNCNGVIADAAGWIEELILERLNRC